MNSHLTEYVDALCQEQRFVSRSSRENISVGTIFFGGGTPSLLSPSHLEKILSTSAECFNLEESREITIEANPGTVDAGYLNSIHSLGINRISFGMQSAHPGDLQILNRQHQHKDVIQAVMWSKQAGFTHINLDLIFGIPGQSLSRWVETLDFALAESVDHFSLYSLSVEEGTPLKKWVERGLLSAPDDDLAAEMYEAATEKLYQAGFEQYEISNWAKKGNRDNRCQHNLQYWRYLTYLGFGAGAHGFCCDTRTENVGGILEYIIRIKGGLISVFPESPASKNSTRLSKWEQMQEYLMVGFRLTEEGVSKTDFLQKFDHPLDKSFAAQIGKLEKQGLIEKHPDDQERLRLTSRGRLFGNKVFTEFIGNQQPADCIA